MLTIIHGDNHVASRNQLNVLIDEAKNKGIVDIVRLEGKKITTTDLIQAVETNSLFGGERLVVIENLFSRLKSKQKDELLNYLSTADSLGNIAEVIVWEDKTLTKTQTKKFTKAKIQEFPITKLMFKFLESVKPGQPKQNLDMYHKTIENDDPEFVFVMFIRQVRMLLQVRGNGSVKMAPWQKSRLESQAKLFTLESLLKLHRKLLELDLAQKTSQNKMNIEGALDILLATI